MISIDSSSNEPAYRYAFALAIQHHLRVFREGMMTQLESIGVRSEEEDLKSQDIVSNIQAVNKFLLRKILMHYKKQDILDDKPVTNSLAFQLKHALLRPPESSFDIGNATKTEDLLSKLDAERDEESEMFSAGERESELGSKLYVVLNNTFDVHRELLAPRVSPIFDTVSYYVGRFLEEIIRDFKDLDFSLVLVNKVNNLIPVLKRFDGADMPSINVLYDKFKDQLKAHLRVLQFDIEADGNNSAIKKLREQGNNLMANLAFAQAIQIYTNATDLCTFVSREHIPQLLTNRAIAYIGLNCFPEAISDLNKAVQIDRTFTPAWTQLGYCHLYMGTSLTALKSYSVALKTATGEILPESFPTDNNKLVQEYRKMKRSSVLRQFSKRVMDAIVLTEKRANQQRESLAETKRIVLEARRSLISVEESSVYSSGMQSSFEDESSIPHLRDLSERANSARPNILNQDVAQNILASSGMEAVTVTGPMGQEERTREAAVSLNPPQLGQGRNDDNQNTSANEPTSQVRTFLNDLGDIVEGATQPSVQSDNTRNRSAGMPNTQNNTEASTNRGSSRSVRDVLRGILPEGFGNAISQTLNTPGTSNHIVINRSNRPHTTSSSIFNRSRRSSSNQGSQRNGADEDIDMPEPENLD